MFSYSSLLLLSLLLLLLPPSACQRRALRWASMGFTVSVGPPSGSNGESSGSTVDKKKAKAEAAAKKKNLELLKTDPPRWVGEMSGLYSLVQLPFLSLFLSLSYSPLSLSLSLSP